MILAKKAVKKAANKKAAKKSGSKKGSEAIPRPRVLVKKVMYVVENVPENYVFYVSDGSIVRNLKDLIDALDTMAEDTFYHHVNDSRNDFSNWIRDIINEPSLSMMIQGKDRSSTKKEIIKYLKKRGLFKG